MFGSTRKYDIWYCCEDAIIQAELDDFSMRNDLVYTKLAFEVRTRISMRNQVWSRAGPGLGRGQSRVMYCS